MENLHMFDYTFLQDEPPQGVALLLEEVKRGQERLRDYRRAYPGIYSAVERAGRVRSLLAASGGGSTEGRAGEICARNSPPITDGERDMAAYRDALFEIQLGHPALGPCRRDLLRLYGLALPRAAGLGGYYREDAGGSPLPPEEVEGAMEAWEQAAQEDSLLAVPCLLADFARIEPFSPGGRRMGYLVARMLLQRAGVALPSSWEETASRYGGLCRAALGRIEEEGYWPFVQCFFMLLYLCGQQAEKAFSLLPGRRMTKKSRVEAVVAGSLTPISKGEICRILPDVSPTTVEAALGELVKGGVVVRHGPARTARYGLA